MPPAESTLLIGTANPGKQRELRALLSDLALILIGPGDLDLRVAFEESGADYASNAAIKARAYARASRLWALADDSGLEVDALAGAPGIRSARLAGPLASDADRRAMLLGLLQGHPRPWLARFRCLAALASPAGRVWQAAGVCQGQIIPRPRGAHGFGYDPIFLLAGLDRTMAELSAEEKNRLSHRAQAIHAIRPLIIDQLGLTSRYIDPPSGA
jgi:XTP/dITP diphosphohydrolase